MSGKIYLIRNVINGKGYVGQTGVSIESRYKKHLENARRGVDLALYRAMRKHGQENFVVTEVATCNRMLLDDLEKHYIKFFGTSAAGGHGYNMTAEHKAKVSAAKKGQGKGKPWSEARRAAQNAKGD